MKTLSLLALALLSQTAPALAETAAPPRSQAVRTADLDLSTRAGQTRLGHRIRIAVNTVCGEASAIDPVGRNEVRQCREDTRRGVQTRLNAAIAAAERGIVVASAN
jgi:UrcA family protein